MPRVTEDYSQNEIGVHLIVDHHKVIIDAAKENSENLGTTDYIDEF